MLPKVMDAAQFMRACGIDSGDFTNFAVTGSLPKALGLYGAKPIWEESAVKAFAESAGLRWDETWGDYAVDAQTIAAPAVVAEPAAAAPPADEPSPQDAFTQADACEYLDVSPSWLKKQEDSGIISGERFSGFKLYRRADLDALRTLPVYRFRKRHGFSHGKPKGPEVPKNVPTPIATANDFLGESAAADFLNLPRETLALARGDGGGPVCVFSNGVPKYRVSDLQAWRDQHAPQRKVAQAIRSTDHNMGATAAAEYLGITKKQYENLLTHARPDRPAPVSIRVPGASPGSMVRRWSAQSLEEWKRANETRLALLQKQGGKAAGRKPLNRKAAPQPKATRPARGRSKVLGNVTKRLEKAPPKPGGHKRPTAKRVEVRA